MSEHCGFNIFEDCNCGGECKSGTVNLGRFTKSPPPTFSTTPITAGLLVIFTLGALWAGICEGAGQQKVIDRDRQEITHVARN
ncbi:hypothetical protein D3C86_2130110 [compost metagenome]